MHEVYTYRVRIQGQLEEKSFNAISPYRITEVSSTLDATQFTVCADQAGVIGLIRHLHQQGFLLLSIYLDG